MVRSDQKAFMGRAAFGVPSGQRASVTVLNSLEKSPEWFREDQGDVCCSGEGFEAQLKHHLCQGGISSWHSSLLLSFMGSSVHLLGHNITGGFLIQHSAVPSRL